MCACPSTNTQRMCILVSTHTHRDTSAQDQIQRSSEMPVEAIILATDSKAARTAASLSALMRCPLSPAALTNSSMLRLSTGHFFEFGSQPEIFELSITTKLRFSIALMALMTSLGRPETSFGRREASTLYLKAKGRPPFSHTPRTCRAPDHPSSCTDPCSFRMVIGTLERRETSHSYCSGNMSSLLQVAFLCVCACVKASK